MLCSDRHSRASFSIVFSFSLSPQEYFLTLVPSLFHLFFLLVAPGPAAINLLMMQQHTYYLLSFVQFCSHTFFYSHAFIFFLSLSRLSLLIVYFLSLSRRTHDAQIFYMCVCVRSFLLFFIFVCVSSFIDYLNVTTKLDISTSSNKLGFCFFFNVCVFPFILNISLLFFKRLKLRIFYPSFDRALLFPPPLCFVYFFLFV